MSTLTDFLEEAPVGTSTFLKALSIPESLTDDAAKRIFELFPIEGVPAALMLEALHQSDMTIARNSEWHIAERVRQEALAESDPSPEFSRSIHEMMLSLAAKGGSRASEEIPEYLFTDAGRAYHLAGLGRLREALDLYSKASLKPLSGQQWLASRLSQEQEQTGAIPQGAIEPAFLRAMTAYREGRKAAAEPLLRNVADRDDVRIEVEIACHALGMLLRQNRRAQAEKYFRKGLSIAIARNSALGEATLSHSLANLLARNAGHARETEKLYRRSLALNRNALSNRYGEAQVLHSLANFMARDAHRREETQALYRQSISIGAEIGKSHHVAQASHSFANFLSRLAGREGDATKLYRLTVELLIGLHDNFGVAQVLHGFANMLARIGHLPAAEALMRASLAIGIRLKRKNHRAQILRSLAIILKDRFPEEAHNLLMESLKLNNEMRNRAGISLVEKELREIRDRLPR